MNANLLSIIKQITAERGEDILENARLLRAFFGDLAKDEPKPLRMAFGKCVENGFYRIIKDTRTAEERRQVIDTLARRLRDAEGLDTALCTEALELLAAAVFGDPALVCAGCGAALKPTWKACPECGKAVQAAPATPTTPATPATPASTAAPEPAAATPATLATPAAVPATPGMAGMIKKRSLAGLVVLSLITFGMYGLYWIYRLAQDANAMCAGDGKKTSGLLRYFLLNLITLGLYGLVWLYKLGNRLRDNAPRYHLACKEGGGTVLLWLIPGAFIIVGPFIALYIIIKNTNALAAAYNQRLAPPDGQDEVHP